MKQGIRHLAETIEILRRLNEAAVEFIVIGGVAAIAYGSPLMTDDVDICAAMRRDNLAKIVQAFQDVEPRWRLRPDLGIVKPDDTYLGQLKNMYLRTGLGILDVLGEIPGVCSYESALSRAVEIDLDGIVCKFIDTETLIAAKRVAGRPHDLRTIEFLEAQKRIGDERRSEK